MANDLIIMFDKATDQIGIMYDDPSETRADHPGQAEEVIDKTEFLRYYEIEEAANNVVSCFYQPKVGMYFVELDTGSVLSFNDPQDHPVLKAFDDLGDQLKTDEMIVRDDTYPGISHRGKDGWLDVLDGLSKIKGLSEKKDRIKNIKDIPDDYFDDQKDPEAAAYLTGKGITKNMKDVPTRIS